MIVSFSQHTHAVTHTEGENSTIYTHVWPAETGLIWLLRQGPECLCLWLTIREPYVSVWGGGGWGGCRSHCQDVCKNRAGPNTWKWVPSSIGLHCGQDGVNIGQSSGRVHRQTKQAANKHWRNICTNSGGRYHYCDKQVRRRWSTLKDMMKPLKASTKL